ncbi:hypothetical protein Tco_0782928 [Tanacetum coccineum]
MVGVGVSSGAEAVLHSVNRVVSGYHNNGSLAMLTVDFSNVFNLVDRSALLHKIKDKCKHLLHAWYLDNGTVIRDSEEAARVLDIIMVSGIFPVNIRRPSLGVKLLGGAVSRDADFISGLAMRRAANAVDLMGLLPYGICGMDDDYVSALDCLRDRIPNFDFSCFMNKDTDFLLAIPIDGLGQHMSPVEYRTILKYHLMIPLFLVDEICLVCCKACLDSFGEHVVHCKELPGFKYRHNMVRDVLFDVCLSSRGFTVGHAAFKAASCKVAKHEKACIENQHVFVSFAFDAFGFLAPEAVELLNRVQ